MTPRHPLLSRHQAQEPLDVDHLVPGPEGKLVRVAVDWSLAEAFRDAIGRLKEDAEVELPTPGQPEVRHGGVPGRGGSGRGA